MTEYKDFSQFKQAIIDILKKDDIEGAWLIGGGALLGGVFGGLVGARAFGSAIPNLNTFLYNEFLEKNYKKRFEEMKNDQTSVKKLIGEATEQIKHMINERNK